MKLYIYVHVEGGRVVTTPLLHKPTAEKLVADQGGEIRSYEIADSSIRKALAPAPTVESETIGLFDKIFGTNLTKRP